MNENFSHVPRADRTIIGGSKMKRRVKDLKIFKNQCIIEIPFISID
ncbi:MAG: hypothetical protein J7J16_04050 [Deltaproteobacteria bacterium]|nr:hypothetical protein [Deltaproteobacteria bacterium]